MAILTKVAEELEALVRSTYSGYTLTKYTYYGCILTQVAEELEALVCAADHIVSRTEDDISTPSPATSRPSAATSRASPEGTGDTWDTEGTGDAEEAEGAEEAEAAAPGMAMWQQVCG